jgi:hypothetical protein
LTNYLHYVRIRCLLDIKNKLSSTNLIFDNLEVFITKTGCQFFFEKFFLKGEKMNLTNVRITDLKSLKNIIGMLFPNEEEKVKEIMDKLAEKGYSVDFLIPSIPIKTLEEVLTLEAHAYFIHGAILRGQQPAPLPPAEAPAVAVQQQPEQPKTAPATPEAHPQPHVAPTATVPVQTTPAVAPGPQVTAPPAQQQQHFTVALAPDMKDMGALQLIRGGHINFLNPFDDSAGNTRMSEIMGNAEFVAWTLEGAKYIYNEQETIKRIQLLQKRRGRRQKLNNIKNTSAGIIKFFRFFDNPNQEEILDVFAPLPLNHDEPLQFLDDDGHSGFLNMDVSEIPERTLQFIFIIVNGWETFGFKGYDRDSALDLFERATASDAEKRLKNKSPDAYIEFLSLEGKSNLPSIRRSPDEIDGQNSIYMKDSYSTRKKEPVYRDGGRTYNRQTNHKRSGDDRGATRSDQPPQKMKAPNRPDNTREPYNNYND